MPLPDAIESLAWDSVSAKLLIGGVTVPALKLGVPKEEIKVELIRRIGEQRPKKRTTGTMELGVLTLEVELGDYTTLVIPRMPIHGGTFVEFVVTLTVTHPNVVGSYGMLFDGGRILTREGPEISPDEKALIKKLGISVMSSHEKGADGKWRCLDLDPKLPSSLARAAMAF